MRSRAIISLTFLIVLFPQYVHAHKLNVFASFDGKNIVGKAYFRGGDPAQNVPVVVFDPTGEEIAKTRTDAEGRFKFEAKSRCDHRILVDIGDGHGGEYTLPGSALSKELPTVVIDRAKPTTAANPPSLSTTDDKIDFLRSEIVRLEQKLDEFEQRTRMTDVLGGIGCILGITGVYYYLSARRKKSAQQSPLPLGEG